MFTEGNTYIFLPKVQISESFSLEGLISIIIFCNSIDFSEIENILYNTKHVIVPYIGHFTPYLSV